MKRFRKLLLKANPTYSKAGLFTLLILSLLLSTGGLIFAEDTKSLSAQQIADTPAPPTTSLPTTNPPITSTIASPPITTSLTTPPSQSTILTATQAPVPVKTVTPSPSNPAKPGAAAVGTIQAGQAPLVGEFYLVAGGTELLYFLSDDTGNITKLNISDTLIEAAGGAWSLNHKRLLVTGLPGSPYPTGSNTPTLDVTSIELDPSVGPVPGGLLPAITGSRPFANILCKFSDNTTEPRTPSYFSGLMSNNYPGMDYYFRQVSLDAINLVGTTVMGWYTLPQPRSYYVYGSPEALNFSRITTDCLAAADPYTNFNLYQGINLMFNGELDSFAWGGSWYMALDGKIMNWPMTWMPPWGYNNQAVLAHEMGHAFGMPHSGDSLGQTYRNVWDIMSDTWTNCNRLTDPTYGCLGQHPIAAYKDIPGWIPSSRVFTSYGSSNTVTLERTALPGSSDYLMVKIPINKSSTHFYTAEARYRVGYDAKLINDAVIIHEVDTTRMNPAWVINVGNVNDTNDPGAQWLPGETFTDAANAISISVNSATATGFVITVVSPPSFTDLIVNGTTLNGNISSNGQEDWYRFTVSTADNYMIETQLGTLPDNYMYLYGPNNYTTLITADDDSGVGWASLISRYLYPGTYYARVRAFNATQTGTYAIRAITLAVGQGSSYAQNYWAAYYRKGGIAGMGYPTDLVRRYGTSGVDWQPFNVGAGLFHHVTGGSSPADIRAFYLSGSSYNYYIGLGGPESWLGAPTSDEFVNSAGLWQVNFANGYLVNTTTGIQTSSWPTSFTAWKNTNYNNNALMSGPSLIKNDGLSNTLSFSHTYTEWVAWQPPLPNEGLLYSDNWSATWERTYTIPAGAYDFYLCGDDGIRLYLDGTRVIDQWKVQGLTCYQYPTTGYQIYTADQSVNFKIEYYQATGGQGIEFRSFKLEPPSTPLTLTALLNTYNYSVSLNWTTSTGNPDGYRVERKAGLNGSWAVIGSNNYAYYYDSNSNLSPGTTYYYRVVAYNVGGSSTYSNESSATIPLTPPPPYLQLVKAVTTSQINLGWYSYSANETGFSIERKTAISGSWSEIATVGAGATQYKDSNLTPVTTYYYRLRAYNSFGYSPYSSEIPASTTIDEWAWQNPVVGNNTLLDLACPQSGLCYAVGYNGTILKTSDSGKSWRVLPTGAFDTVSGISCTGKNSCYAVGYYYGSSNGLILKTTDGINWTTQNLPANTKTLSNISCPNPTTCYALGSYSGSTILKTTDGTNWSAQNFTYYLSSISCPSLTTCYATGSSSNGKIILKTSDGTNWLPTNLTLDTSIYLYDLHCPAQTTCYAVGSAGAIVKTTDGANWTSQPSGNNSTYFYLNSIYCSTTVECQAVGGSYNSGTSPNTATILTTHNGSTWTTQTNLLNKPLLEAVYCTDGGQNCYAVGNSGFSLKSDNGGNNWFDPSNSFFYNLLDLTCLNTTNPTTCYAVGSTWSANPPYWTGVIMKTTDGGRTWVSQSVPDGTTELETIYCLNATLCYAGGYGSNGGVLIKTFDGLNWFSKVLPTGTGTLYDLKCLDSNICYAVGSDGYINGSYTSPILKTVDGANWNFQNISPNPLYFLQSIDCPNITTCYAVGNNFMAKTIDGGVNWNYQTAPSTIFYLNAISCTNSTNCIAAGAGSSTPPGASPPNPNNPPGASPPNPNNPPGANPPNSNNPPGANPPNSNNPPGGRGGVGGGGGSGNGSIARTTDGSNWTASLSWGNTALNSIVCFPSTTTCVMAGSDTWKTTDMGANWLVLGSPGYLYGLSCPTQTACYGAGYAGTLLAKAFPVYQTFGAGTSNTEYTLAYALNKAVYGQTINLRPTSATTINLSGTLDTLPRGVALNGTCTTGGPGVTLQGNGLFGTGLTLNGYNLVYGLRIKGFVGSQIKNSGIGNKLVCVQAQR